MIKPVLCYSYTGHSIKRAGEFASGNNAEIVEVKSAEKISKLKAYTIYCYRAMKGKGAPIEPLPTNFSDYSEVDVFAPIWAGNIAPPMSTALQQLTKGTKVSLHLVSGSGRSNQEKITAQLTALGLEIIGYEDLK